MRHKIALVVNSDRANDEQLASLFALYDRDHDEYPSFEHMRLASWIGYDGILFVPWCNMTIGIERDGYAHS